MLSITCTSRNSLFGCNWLQFLPAIQLIRPKVFSFSTALC
jgi:hypothetical protein